MLPHQFFSKISARDRSLMLALDLHEDATCSCGCGQSVEYAYDSDSEWDLVEVTCHARRALDSDTSERAPGTFLVVRPKPAYLERKASQED